MLELYKTFHQPIWTIALFIALYFPIKKILYQLYMKKFFKDNNNKIKSRSEGPGGLSKFKYFSNPYVGKGQSAVNSPKGVFPKG